MIEFALTAIGCGLNLAYTMISSFIIGFLGL